MTLLAQVNLKTVSGLPEDDVINTFHADRAFGGVLADWFEAIAQFYILQHTFMTQSLDKYLSDELVRGAGGCTVRIYDLDDPEPRIPQFVDTFGLGAASSAESLPSETLTDSPRIAASEAGCSSALSRPTARR